MKRFAKLLLVTVGFGALGFVMSLVPRKNATGAGGAPVNIMSPLPLPVTGTVGITGQPISVNVSNSPTVGLAAGTTIPIKNVDEPGRSPYQETIQVGGTTTGCQLFCFTNFTFSAVPANQRLVIKQVSIDYFVATGGIVPAAELNTVAGGITPFFLPLTLQSTAFGNDERISNQQVNFFVDATHQPQVSLVVDAAHAVNIASNVTLSGYFVSLP